MFFDALTMASVADQLRATIRGGRVQRVFLFDSLSVGLEIYAQRQRHYLLAYSSLLDWARPRQIASRKPTRRSRTCS